MKNGVARSNNPFALLARIAGGESKIYEAAIPPQEQFALLREVSTQRTRLERSFTAALRELKQLQKERQARRPQPAPGVRAAQPPVHPPAEPQVPIIRWPTGRRPTRFSAPPPPPIAVSQPAPLGL